MSHTKAQSAQDIRHILVERNFLPALLDAEIIGTTAYIRGRLAHGDNRPILAEEVERLETQLRGLAGIDDVVFQLERWEKVQGRWVPKPPVDETGMVAFVMKHIPSIFALQALLFFHKNPGTLDNVMAISTRLGAGPGPTQKVLDELTEAGWLKRIGRSIIAYQYSPDPERRSMMARIQSLHDRTPADRARLFRMITQTGDPER